MSPEDLSTRYRAYIDCLNRQDWTKLGRFVHDDVEHNERKIGLSGYRDMLEADFLAIPDLRFDIRLLVSEPPCIASCLHFDCTPVGDLFGLPVNGARVRFNENVFYKFADGKIRWVWSVIDKAAIASQL
jgi:predicted ester cyclase